MGGRIGYSAETGVMVICVVAGRFVGDGVAGPVVATFSPIIVQRPC